MVENMAVYAMIHALLEYVKSMFGRQTSRWQL